VMKRVASVVYPAMVVVAETLKGPSL
jgi:hypothetical protein